MEVEREKDVSLIVKMLNKSKQSFQPKQRVGLEIVQTTRFYLPPQNKSIKAQYCHIYCLRMFTLSKRFEQLNNDPLKVDLIQKIQNQAGVIKAIGTLFKEMKLKPYYFSQSTQTKQTNYVSNDDICYLEDKSGRVKLQIINSKLKLPNGQEKIINPHDLVTGLTIAIEGHIIANNIVKVDTIYLPDFIEAPIYKPLNQTSYLCLISGLDYSAQGSNIKLKHLVTYLQGNLYNSEGNEVPSLLSQIIIAGNLYAPLETQDCLTGDMKMQQDFKQLYSKLQTDMKGVDELINQLAAITPVAIMPGQNEPVSQMWPQTPLHRAHFEETFDQDNKVVFLPNPSEFELGNLKIIGTSGQNIQDIKKYSIVKDQKDIDLIEMTLLYGHIAPTLPDTLISFPQLQCDPFVLEQFPNLYFVGNMTEFGMKKISKNLTIISVPSFAQTGTVCIVDLNTLNCFPIIIQ